ncbi:MAG: alpha/beta hydrolase fold domain-containing protein, partial [Clostridia bacterium]
MSKNRRKYDVTLLDAMKRGQREEMFEGVKILVKPIPEGGEPGDMDKRIYKSMKMAMTMMKFMPKKKEKPQTVLEQVLPLRKMFNGIKSRPIADDGVVAKTMFVESSDKHKVELRMYKREKAGKNLPIMVYYHGGGYFGGSPDVVEQMCKLLVQNLDCIAFNVDYRLCPEAHYPQPFEDCFNATKYVYDNAAKFGGDKNKICVSGDSAGGNMAASITMKDKTEKLNMIKAQILLYPATNMSDKKPKFAYDIDETKYQVSERHKKLLYKTLTMM